METKDNKEQRKPVRNMLHNATKKVGGSLNRYIDRQISYSSMRYPHTRIDPVVSRFIPTTDDSDDPYVGEDLMNIDHMEDCCCGR